MQEACQRLDAARVAVLESPAVPSPVIMSAGVVNVKF